MAKHNSRHIYVIACLVCLCGTWLLPPAESLAVSWSAGIKRVLNPIQTTRDDRGVWFIRGDADAPLYDVFKAMGYAVATDRLWQAETYRRSARGRLAEILGPSQLSTDVFMRTIGYSDQELADGFAALDEEARDVISGYVAGFNQRIAEVTADPTLLPFEFKALKIVPAAWTTADVLAWAALLQRNFDPEALKQHQIDNMTLYSTLAATFPASFQGMFEDLRWTDDPAALTYIRPAAQPAVAAAAAAAATAVDPAAIPDYAAVSRHIDDRFAQVVDNLKRINAYVKMGSYAWSVAGSKTASGNPIIYSGPQMGFTVPSIVLEGSIQAGGLDISGMSVAGIPGIIIGRTPHHAWSMQVANAHTIDYYLESPIKVSLHRMETIKVAGAADVTLPVFRSAHGPIINPMPYDAAQVSATNPAIAWKYAHWGYEFDLGGALLGAARAQNMDQFGAAMESFAVSQHFCYADRDGNIAYWMSGRDPVRPAGEWRLPQGFFYAQGVAPLEWDAAVLKPRSTDRNAVEGFYGGWNNKNAPDTDTGMNAAHKQFGPYDRAHVVNDYLSTHDDLTFEQLRDLALNIASTDSIDGGGNPWQFAAPYFTAAVNAAGANQARQDAINLLNAWDGHFVDGGADQWPQGTDRADAWELMDAWVREVLRMTFADELGALYDSQDQKLLFNVLLHGLAGSGSGIVNTYNWFQNLSDAGAAQTADGIIVAALDAALADLGPSPWGANARGEITYTHDMLGKVHSAPFFQRSTYAHCVEFGPDGPVRIESMFPPSGRAERS